MKLDEKTKNEIRTQIIEKLKQVPEGMRISLDNELLDELIFFKGKGTNGVTYKVPIWTGPFLRKLDLSSISFENAIMSSFPDEIIFDEKIEDIMDAEPLSRFRKIEYSKGGFYYEPPFCIENCNDRMIDFSGTNIKIDFSKIYSIESGHVPGRYLECCDLSYVDLSDQSLDDFVEVRRCNLAQTNVKINFDQIKAHVSYTDLSNNDYSGQTLDAKLFNVEDLDSDLGHLLGTNLANTGVNIIYNPTAISEEAKEATNLLAQLEEKYNAGQIPYEFYFAQKEKLIKSVNQQDLLYSYKDCFDIAISEGELDGCYVNGARVLSKKEQEEIADQMLGNALNSIDNQLSGGMRM